MYRRIGKKYAMDLLMVMIAGAIASMSARAPAQANPLGYLELDEGEARIAYDSVNGNHGMICEATWASGKVGGALSFDGQAEAIVPNPEAWDSLENTAVLTILVWSNSNGTQGRARILSIDEPVDHGVSSTRSTLVIALIMNCDSGLLMGTGLLPILRPRQLFLQTPGIM